MLKALTATDPPPSKVLMRDEQFVLCSSKVIDQPTAQSNMAFTVKDCFAGNRCGCIKKKMHRLMPDTSYQRWVVQRLYSICI